LSIAAFTSKSLKNDGGNSLKSDGDNSKKDEKDEKGESLYVP
jgi:hypothetical protein